MALGHNDPTAAATLLLDIGDDEAAEAQLLAEPGRIHGDNDGALVPLAQALHARQRLRGETAIYRARTQGRLLGLREWYAQRPCRKRRARRRSTAMYAWCQHIQISQRESALEVAVCDHSRSSKVGWVAPT